MSYDECVAMIDFLNERFRQAGMTPWFMWAVRIDWEKIRRWCAFLGYDRGQTDDLA